MSKHWCYTLRRVLAEVFVDEASDLDPGVAVSLSNLGEQVGKTGQTGSVEMTVSDSLMLKIQLWHLKYSFLYLSPTAERWWMNDIYWKLSTALPAHL